MRPDSTIRQCLSHSSVSLSARRATRVAGLSAVVLVVAGLVAGCGKKDDKVGGPPGGPGGPGGQALPVTVQTVQLQSLPVTVEAVGQSEGSREVQVRARVSGILLKQRFNEGDRVKAGAPLYQIDPVPYEIALSQARAALAQARASSEQAQREEGRLKPLAADQAVSGREYDDSVSSRKTAAAMVQAREADVRTAELNLQYTRVFAPISGISGRNVSSEGSLVTAGTDSALLTTIVQTDPVWVRFSVSESEYASLRANNGDNAKVELVTSDGKTYAAAGKLNFAASTVDRTLGTVQLRAEVPNPELKILPGQFIRARLFIGQVQGVLVPQGAVMTSDKGKAAMVVGPDNKATPKPVVAGAWQGGQIVVTQGLANGDQVIVDNLVKVRPGAPVAPHPPQQPGQPQGQGPGGPPQGQGEPAKTGAPDETKKADAKS